MNKEIKLKTTKIYQRPLLEIINFKFVIDSLIMIFSIWVICKHIIFSGTLDNYAAWIALGILSPGILAVWYSILGKYFYIILFDDKIVVQNYFLPFFRICRKYNEINKVRFWMPTPNQWGIESIEIARAGRKRGGLFYGISMVNPKDYLDIVSALESKGVKVDVFKNLSPKEYREVHKKIRRGEL